MPGDNSFDPKSWASKPEAEASLPDAWKSVVDSVSPASTIEREVAAPAPPTKSAQLPAWLPYAGSVLLIAISGGTAWTMRQPTPLPLPAASSDPVGPDEATQAVNAPTVSNRTLVLAGPQDLLSALIGAGLSQDEAGKAAQTALSMLGNAPGEIRAALQLASDKSGTHVIRLEASHPDGSGAVVSVGADGQFAATRVAAELSKQIKIVRGELDSNSFYSSAVAAGVIDTLIPEFINAFSFDFDLQQEVNPGDTFEVAYEQTVNANGEAMGQPQLVYVSLTTPAKRKSLYRFAPPGGEVGWYDGNGASTVRSFMRTPVDGARISSKFGYRIHPIYGYSKLHGGTDFASPQGTPVYASGDAVAEFVAPKGCNGNFIRLHHDNGWYTHYLHLVRFGEGMAAGVRVKQGQIIGYVGTTGCSTGPHLHYEVVIDGQKVDPLSIKTESGRKGLEGPTLAGFIQQRDRVDVARARQIQ